MKIASEKFRFNDRWDANERNEWLAPNSNRFKILTTISSLLAEKSFSLTKLFNFKLFWEKKYKNIENIVEKRNTEDIYLLEKNKNIYQ